MNIDRKSAVAVHWQIAQELRYQIATGNLKPGDRLPSARGAARRWNVNFHTVRRAYQELESMGFVRICGPRGTIVEDRQVVESSSDFLSSFVDEIILRSVNEPEITIEHLILLLRKRARSFGKQTGDITVVECNTTQASELAEQVTKVFDVAATPYVLGRHRKTPVGLILSTLFHRDEVVSKWPEWVHQMQFLPIHPVQAILERAMNWLVDHNESTVNLLECDTGTAQGMIRDLESRLHHRFRIEHVFPTRSGQIRREDLQHLCFVAPRLWDGLSKNQQARRNVVKVQYEFDRLSLGYLGASMGWHPVANDSGMTTSSCPMAVG